MTPKQAAMECERVLKEAGYTLGDLTFSEVVGSRVATYDFGGEVITGMNISGDLFIAASAPIGARSDEG